MSSRKKGVTVAVMITALALAGTVVAGCSMYRWTKIEPGEYTVLHNWAVSNEAAAREIQRLDIDRDARLMILTLVDGSEIVTSFVPRDRTEWPFGCPSNISSTRMEVLEIAEDPLGVGLATFSRPILVRDCPPDPMRLVLREDGEIGGSGSACPHAELCIFFGR